MKYLAFPAIMLVIVFIFQVMQSFSFDVIQKTILSSLIILLVGSMIIIAFR